MRVFVNKKGNGVEVMLLAGIAGHPGIAGAATLISSIFSSRNKKVSVVDASSLSCFDVHKLKKYIDELEKNHVDILIIKMNGEDLEQKVFNSLHFDIMIYDNKADACTGEGNCGCQTVIRALQALVGDKGVLIMNADDAVHSQLPGDKLPGLVTYGFNPNASVVPSSIGDPIFYDGLLCCLQKAVPTTQGSTMEPQEYRLKADEREPDAYNMLAAASFAIVNGVDPNVIL